MATNNGNSLKRFLLAFTTTLGMGTCLSSAQAIETGENVHTVAPPSCGPLASMNSPRSCNVPGYKQIRTLTDLKSTSINLRAPGDTQFILCNDIDVSALGNQNAGFISKITLDGNGYTIRGLSQIPSAFTPLSGGLFESISNSTIKNLRLESPKASGTADAGALASFAGYSRFENIIVDNAEVSSRARAGLLIGFDIGSNFDGIILSGTIKAKALVGEDTKNGGLVGWAEFSKINRVAAQLKMTEGGVIGGIAGQLTKASIENSSAAIDVSYQPSTGGLPGGSENPRITGGIVGLADCLAGTCGNSIKRSYASGTMNASGTFGGIVGMNLLQSNLQLTEISDVRSDVNVIFKSAYPTSYGNALGRGGIVGQDFKGSLTIANALYSGKALLDVNALSQVFGGLVGIKSATTASVASFFDKTGTPHAVDILGGNARTAAQLATLKNYQGWNISTNMNSSSTWLIPSRSYPILSGGIQPESCASVINY